MVVSTADKMVLMMVAQMVDRRVALKAESTVGMKVVTTGLRTA